MAGLINGRQHFDQWLSPFLPVIFTLFNFFCSEKGPSEFKVSVLSLAVETDLDLGISFIFIQLWQPKLVQADQFWLPKIYPILAAGLTDFGMNQFSHDRVTVWWTSLSLYCHRVW